MQNKTGLQAPAKWVGKKARLMPAIAKLMPAMFSKEPVPRFLNFKKGVGDFHDPFAGTGSAFLHFANGFKGDRQIYISDSNPDLVNLWKCIQQEPLELLYCLFKYKRTEANTNEFYLIHRSWFNEIPLERCDPYTRAAMMLYLIQACFNSLWRVNKSGGMNTPYGKQNRVILPTENDLMAIAELLQKAVIRDQSFEEALKVVKPNDLVYLDPPYVEVNKNSFTKYTTKGFSRDQQILLRNEADRLYDLGAFVYASNSDTALTREIWSGWKTEELMRSGCMNSDATKRQSVKELLFYR